MLPLSDDGRKNQMLFASYISKYRTTLQRESATFFGPGQKNVHQQRVVAQFRPGVPDFVVAALRKKWPKMPVIHPSIGSPDGPVPWHSVCSIWDSKEAQKVYGWTDEEREKFEQKLKSHPRFGLRFIEVVAEKIPAPWPAYDKLTAQGRRTIEMVAETIATKVREDGYTPADVIAYERENLNRQQVIEAIENITDVEDALTAA